MAGCQVVRRRQPVSAAAHDHNVVSALRLGPRQSDHALDELVHRRRSRRSMTKGDGTIRIGRPSGDVSSTILIGTPRAPPARPRADPESASRSERPASPDRLHRAAPRGAIVDPDDGVLVVELRWVTVAEQEDLVGSHARDDRSRRPSHRVERCGRGDDPHETHRLKRAHATPPDRRTARVRDEPPGRRSGPTEAGRLRRIGASPAPRSESPRETTAPT